MCRHYLFREANSFPRAKPEENSNYCSKTVFKYSDYLLLKLKNIVGILGCVLPELNNEE